MKTKKKMKKVPPTHLRANYPIATDLPIKKTFQISSKNHIFLEISNCHFIHIFLMSKNNYQRRKKLEFLKNELAGIFWIFDISKNGFICHFFVYRAISPHDSSKCLSWCVLRPWFKKNNLLVKSDVIACLAIFGLHTTSIAWV